MKIKLIYYLRFILHLFKKSPAKTIFLVLCLLTFHFAGTFPNYKESVKIDKAIKVDTGWVYLHQKISENKIKYELIHSTQPLKIENGYYISDNYHEMNVLCWVSSVISGVLLLIASFSSDTGWDADEAREAAISELVTCEYEDGVYLYFIGDRLMGKKKHEIQKRRYLSQELSLSKWSDVTIRPIYHTKDKKRQNALEKLGIF